MKGLGLCGVRLQVQLHPPGVAGRRYQQFHGAGPLLPDPWGI